MKTIGRNGKRPDRSWMPVVGHLGAMLRVRSRRPRAFAQTLGLALKVGRIDDRGMVRTLIYFAEACVLLEWTGRAGC